ncbi:hypothetical protein [Sphingomonas baiyangensis]|uniref:Uncharacterized protein n=1 Tax=Sphingomonas baiyangensis TaxID=2572576 RepID=A0A4U1L3T6_9SPHN|nr:hypothetical protein [Sphingomonas baiyangensis]TKD51549.1 hypothetical protein FBR43_12880 [Sphingomonas baiyangensis]
MPAETLTRTIDLPSGAVTAEYRGDVEIATKQIGAVAPGGRPSTLRCSWTASLNVERQATGGGVIAARSFTLPKVAEGSRSGWCDGQRKAIGKEVAQRVQTGAYLERAANADRGKLRADFDQLASARR